jgi:hypothetical protein
MEKPRMPITLNRHRNLHRSVLSNIIFIVDTKAVKVQV